MMFATHVSESQKEFDEYEKGTHDFRFTEVSLDVHHQFARISEKQKYSLHPSLQVTATEIPK